ncbi:MAG: hypothetical protein LBK60_00235 [Verrucomicrobiales bacterium]|jgi:hypothetical protein|nr:hypothetical protein [Verrucomicrobiales bacterium]
MANTFSNLDVEIIARSAVVGFRQGLLPLDAISKNVSPEPAERGNSVKVLRLSSAGTVQTFDPATGYAIADSTADGVDVALDKHKFVSWQLTDKEKIGTAISDIETFGLLKGWNLAKQVLTDVLAAVTAAKFGAAVTSSDAADFDLDAVFDIRNALTVAGWPPIGRALVLDSAYYANLLKELKIASAAGGDAELRNGTLTRLAGFNVFESAIIPANGEDLKGFAVEPDALLVALRYLAPQEGHKYEIAEPVVDADSGVTLGLRQWYDENSGSKRCVLEALYGSNVGNPAALKRIVSAS